MTHISMGMLSAILLLLKAIHNKKIHEKCDLLSYVRCSFVDMNLAIDLSLRCSWLVSHDQNSFFVTEKGSSIIEGFNNVELSKILLRDMLYTYALSCNPVWVYRVPKGRKEASLFMSLDEKRCFYEAGLLSEDIDEECISWWDCLSLEVRSDNNLRLLETGRKAELLTLQYEKNRTGNQPDWRSFDTNLVGYDVLSILERDDLSKLLIEVKASSLPIEKAFMIITSHEWEVAIQSRNYVFHLWSLDGIPKLGVIRVDEIRPHIPQNIGKGEWKNAKIPFLVFRKLFSSPKVLENIPTKVLSK